MGANSFAKVGFAWHTHADGRGDEGGMIGGFCVDKRGTHLGEHLKGKPDVHIDLVVCEGDEERGRSLQVTPIVGRVRSGP